MPKYMFHVSYRPEAVQAILKDGGTARRSAAETAINSVGGSLEAFYFAFGSDDAVMIADAPSNVAVAALALTAAAGGAVGVRTTVLLTPEEVDAAAKTAVTYSPPGS